ncbi:MAG: hypothetical protein GX941_03060 [Candidatus Methanofastidiosa archaeon]|nr:hypothetical protein [Candidatus Methanofastidiosa archaeon]
MNDFYEKFESTLYEFSHKQISFFMWLFSIRLLPFLGENKTLQFWREEDRQKNIYAIFLVLDKIAESFKFENVIATKLNGNKEPSKILERYRNGKIVNKIPLFGDEHENITLAAFMAKDEYSHIPTATINFAYNISILTTDAVNARLIINEFFKCFDIELLKTEKFRFDDIILTDLELIKSNKLENLNKDTNIYGCRWNNFISALKDCGCQYWGNLLDNFFSSGFKINEQALEHRLNVPKNIKDQGAKMVAEYLKKEERNGSVNFKRNPKYFAIEFHKISNETEAEGFIYKRCVNCYETCESKHSVCPKCSGELTSGLGIKLKNESDRNLFKMIEAAKKGYDLTCGKCGNIFFSMTTLGICPRCNDEKPKNYMPHLDGVKLTQEIKIIKKNATTNKKVLEMNFRDEKPQADGNTAMFRRIIDKENNDYQELVVVNQTGETKHKCHELLSEHQGHGSAKNKQKSCE